MNYTLPRIAREPISERDAVWFEELTEAIDRGRIALLSRQPWSSQVGDTTLSLMSLADAGQDGDSAECKVAIRWLLTQTQELRVDETASVLIAIVRNGYALRAACADTIHRSLNSLLESQNQDGGWSASGRGGAQTPSCGLVTAHVLGALSWFGFRVRQSPVDSAVKFLLTQQDERDTWTGAGQTLVGLQAIGFDMTSLAARRAVRRLKESQNEDGGWGEGESTASRTAWALLGLLAAGEVEGAEARAGAEYLVGTQRGNGAWGEQTHASACFALMAIGRYMKQSASSYATRALVA